MLNQQWKLNSQFYKCSRLFMHKKDKKINQQITPSTDANLLYIVQDFLCIKKLTNWPSNYTINRLKRALNSASNRHQFPLNSVEKNMYYRTSQTLNFYHSLVSLMGISHIPYTLFLRLKWHNILVHQLVSTTKHILGRQYQNDSQHKGQDTCRKECPFGNSWDVTKEYFTGDAYKRFLDNIWWDGQLRFKYHQQKWRN